MKRCAARRIPTSSASSSPASSRLPTRPRTRWMRSSPSVDRATIRLATSRRSTSRTLSDATNHLPSLSRRWSGARLGRASVQGRAGGAHHSQAEERHPRRRRRHGSRARHRRALAPRRQTAAAAHAAGRIHVDVLQATTAPRVLGVMQRQDDDLEDPAAPLAVLAKWTIDKLSKDPDGFFLLIEEEGIDSSSHSNRTDNLRKALAQYDAALGVALDFASAHGDTLVIAVGDHETGGLRIFQTPDTHRRR